MKVTDAFLGEHGVFYAQFDWIEEALAVQPDRASVTRLAGMLAAALATHAALENELLLDAAEGAAGASVGPFTVMREEHDRIESLVDRVARASDADAARDDLAEAIRLARDHFEKEERVAFPMAEEFLGEGRLRAAGREWGRRRGVALGHDFT